MTESDLTDLEIRALQQRIDILQQKGEPLDATVVELLEQAIEEYAAGETVPIDAIDTQDERLNLIAALLTQPHQQKAIVQLQAFSNYVTTHQLLQLTRLFLKPSLKTASDIQTVSDRHAIYPPQIVETFQRLLAANPSAAAELRSNPATADLLKNAGLSK